MFGNNNQQQTQDDNGAFQASMPDPLSPTTASPDGSQATDSPPNGPNQPNYNTPELPAAGTPDPAPSSSSAPVAGKDDLINLKQQALQHLSPLVGHLDQTPEEKFRTTMMMIQASDDQSLIKSAFEAAKQITDDKARAQAFLDVINEINYFTQHNQQ